MENTNLDTVLEEVADEVETIVPADNSSFVKNGLIVSGVVAGVVGLATYDFASGVHILGARKY